MRILGIDPGTATTGYGAISNVNGQLKLLDFGWIKTSKDLEPGDRYILMYREMISLLNKVRPDVMAVERLFFNFNVKTALSVSEAIGIILLAGAKKKIKVVRYTPLQVKKVITGYGRASKDEMKKKIRKILKFRSPNRKKTHFDDVCDALAIAVCHAKLLKNT
jgi:crossover junction endodeoxyribonuclease RuvC